MPPLEIQAVSQFDEQLEQKSEIRAFRSGENTLLNEVTRADILRGATDKEVLFFVNLEKLIKSDQNSEQIINFVLENIANEGISSNRFHKFISYAEYCPLLEAFVSIPNEKLTAQACRDAIGNKKHEIWGLLIKCESMNARVLHMGFIQERYSESDTNMILADTRGLINEIGLRHRTQEIEKSSSQKIKINRQVIKRAFATASGFFGKY